MRPSRYRPAAPARVARGAPPARSLDSAASYKATCAWSSSLQIAECCGSSQLRSHSTDWSPEVPQTTVSPSSDVPHTTVSPSSEVPHTTVSPSSEVPHTTVSSSELVCCTVPESVIAGVQVNVMPAKLQSNPPQAHPHTTLLAVTLPQMTTLQSRVTQLVPHASPDG